MSCDIENEDENEKGASDVSGEPKRSADFFPPGVDSLTDEDVKSPAFVKMIVSQNKKQEKEIEKLKSREDDYVDTKIQLGVLNERLRSLKSTKILRDFMYAIGGVIISMSTADYSDGVTLHNIFFLIVGIAMILGSAISEGIGSKKERK